jgi:hypothetical protein
MSYRLGKVRFKNFPQQPKEIQMSNVTTQDGQVITEFKFRFKEDKLGNKRPNVSLMVPTITLAMIASIAQKTEVVKDDKGNETEQPTKAALLIKEAVDAIYQDQIRSIVSEKEDVSQSNFPFEQSTWEFIANMDRTSRRGAGIPKELWDGFAEDYCKVMPAVTGKTAEQVAQAANVLVRKFKDVTGNLPVVKKMMTYLAMYSEAAGAKAEEYTDILEFLAKKGKDMLDAENKVEALNNL